jgi:hypothetical protein
VFLKIRPQKKLRSELAVTVRTEPRKVASHSLLIGKSVPNKKPAIS